MFTNPILRTDSYKVTHWKQYPPNTTEIYSYFESRKKDANVVFFGLQYLLKEYFSKPITRRDLDEAFAVISAHLGDASLFNEAGWRKITGTHRGMLPVEIMAVPEGTVVPGSNVMMTVRNIDPDLPWVTNYVETILSQLWYPCTVATVSAGVRKNLKGYLKATTDFTDAEIDGAVAFMLHDFGFRGASSVETASIGGAAHLLSFKGTDTMAALEFLRNYYSGPLAAGFSIPAAEHSTITSWGRENEFAAYENMLTQFPKGLVAIVSDSYDIRRAVREAFCGTLFNLVENREGLTVIRPDSGDPVTILRDIFGYLDKAGFARKTFSTGHMLFDKVRVIWGDGINPVSIDQICKSLVASPYSIANMAFGMGGALLQRVDRDTFSFAFKCSNAVIDGKSVKVSKSPVDMPEKKSKGGYLSLGVNDNGMLETFEHSGDFDSFQIYGRPTTGDVLELAYRPGYIREAKYADISERALKF